MKAKKRRKESRRVIRDYDMADTSTMIDSSRPLKFVDLGLRLPDIPPTQVISIRLPSRLLNELKAISSERDIPYQALIKLLLSESVSHYKRRSSS
jgi:CopG antitoxin of type II toxin-antitoxin system